MNYTAIPTDDLIKELKRRKANTYLEDAEWCSEWTRATRGRGNSSKSAELLLALEVGDVKRLYHEDIFCHHAPRNNSYYCGLARKRDALKKQGINFSIHHEKEHVAIVWRKENESLVLPERE